MSKFDNKTWNEIPLHRKMWFNVLLMFVFWPFALLNCITGPIYKKAMPFAQRAKIARIMVAFFPVLVGAFFAFLIVVMPNSTQSSQSSTPSQPAQASQSETISKHVCTNQKVIMSVIKHIPIFMTLHVTPVEIVSSKTVSVKPQSVRCLTTVLLSSDEKKTFKIHAFLGANGDTLISSQVVK